VRTTRKHQAFVGIVAFALLAAACGKDKTSDSASGASSSTSAASAGSTTASSTASSAAASSTTAGATTTAAAAAKLGVDAANPKLYNGAGGFKIDLSKCPSDYKIDQGITADKITVAISLPKSGAFQGFGPIQDGMDSYFKYINAKGGVGGKKIELQFKDDAYDAARTKTNVDDFIGQGNIAAFVGVLGSPNNLAVWDKLNEQCYPQLFNATGLPQWGDVENHPWTTGLQLDYFSEAKIWAEYLKGRFPNGTKVALLYQNSDFGKSYQKGFKSAVKGSKIEVVSEASLEPTAANAKDQITTLAATKAEVLVAGVSGGAGCTDSMRQVSQSDWKPLMVLSGTCSAISSFFKPLDPTTPTDPHPGDGVLLVLGGKDVTDDSQKDDPAVKLFRDTVTAQGIDPKVTPWSTVQSGWTFAEYFVKTMEKAATYNGGINRPNIMLAARDLDFVGQFALPGITTKSNGLQDAYMIEGGMMKKYTWNAGKPAYADAEGAKVINLEGQTGTFAKISAAA
jgi:ABC-type branched-subunit amino acid transport system substrate-binding protein